jgi:outer membrane protein
MSNRRRALWSAAALGLVLSLGAQAAVAESLLDAVALAYETNPDLQQQRAQQRVIDEGYVQARSGFRPDASASASGTWFDGASGFGDTTSWSSSVGLSLSQPIWTGGRVATAVDAARADILQGRENLRTVESQVMLSVVQAYVDVRRDVDALAINRENVRVLQRQLEEASARFDVGEITRTDVAQAEARLAAAQARLSTAEAQLSVSRAAYASVVGQAPGELAPEPALPGLPASFDEAIDIANQDAPNVRAAQYAQQATRARVAAARAEYRPSVSVSASYGAAVSPGGGSIAERDEARATASLTVPLFTGGVTGSRVRQAIERDNIAIIGVNGARRDALQAVSQAYAQVLATAASLKANEEQVRAASIAAEGVRQEAQVGLRTTLDVLNAEQELRDAQLALINSRHDSYVANARLLQAMGRLEAPYLVQSVKVYDPKANYDRVKGKGGVPWEYAVEALDQVAKPSGEHAGRAADAPIDTQLKAKAPTKPLPKKP